MFMYGDDEEISRKFAKTCVEKKRRDRINRCLDQLKELLLENDDTSQYQKLEKAEILEMTVDFIRYAQSNFDHFDYGYERFSQDFSHFIQTSTHLHSEQREMLLQTWKYLSHQQRMYRRRIFQYERLQKFRCAPRNRSRHELWKPYI